MKIGEACAIFRTIKRKDLTDEEKGQAILQVCEMPTHNGITKAEMMCVIWYLLNLAFDVPSDAIPPDEWEKAKYEIGKTCEDNV